MLGGNGGPYNYSWTFILDPFCRITEQYVNVSPASSSSYYYVTVSDNCETPENNDSILVTWHDLPTGVIWF